MLTGGVFPTFPASIEARMQWEKDNAPGVCTDSPLLKLWIYSLKLQLTYLWLKQFETIVNN